FADADHGFVVGAAETVLRTDDGGGKWTGVPFGFKDTALMKETTAHVLMPYGTDPSYTLLDVHALSASVVWMSSRKPIKQPPVLKDPDTLTAAFRSDDGGGSWTRVMIGTN